MNTPLFGVVVPVYNVSQQFFEPCIRSLLHQTFSEIEIILVDDGSREECAKLCDRYAEEDSRIRVIHQQNQGVSAARNAGIYAAKAPWIMFVDADDWLEPNACERLKPYLEKQNCDMLLYNAVKEKISGQEKLKYGFEHGCLYETNDVATRERLYLRAMQVPNANGVRLDPVYYSWDKVFKRTFLVENELIYPVGIPKSEDKVFILSCFEKMRSLYYVEDSLYHYRINAESVCHRYSESADRDRIKLARRLKEIAERMDKQLADLKRDPQYNRITKTYQRFIFGIISDVLFLKYYHPDNPQKEKRAKDARVFIKTEPFYTAIRECRYTELGASAKVKKLMLSLGLVSLFCGMYRWNKRK